MALSRLTYKFLAGIVITQVLVFVAIIVSLTARQKSILLEQIKQKGQNLVQFIANISTEPVLVYDITRLEDYVNDITRNDPGIIIAEIYDRTNKVIAAAERKKRKDENIIEFEASILFNNDKIGKVKLGMSTLPVDYVLKRAQITILAVSVAGIGLLTLLIYFLSNGLIIKPILSMKEISEKLASGDLSARIDIKSNDEIGSLAGAINQVAVSLREIISGAKALADKGSKISEEVGLSAMKVLSGAQKQQTNLDEVALSIEGIDNSASEVAMGADSLAASSEQASSAIAEMASAIQRIAESAQQFSLEASSAASSVEELVASIKEISESLETVSASTEETASTVTEINTTLKEVEQSATESARLAEKVTMEAETKGIRAAEEAIKGIDGIRESVVALSEVIGRLGRRSEEIGKIINVIDEVAGQTSLLALNAAILAAQAGEHGKGFSVVADQIKALAERTGQSTKEIAGLIKAVQEETKASVEMVERGLRKVEEGVRLVGAMNEALRTISESSRQSTEKAKVIQRAMAEQAGAIKQITETIRNINEQIEHISRATKEQTRGSRLIIETVEKIRELSQHVKKATEEQSKGSNQIREAVGNVTHQAEEIAKATAMQRDKTRQMVHAAEEIKKVSLETVRLAEEMNRTVRSLDELTKSLVREMERFRIG
ncbi:MAG: methyl-accepting chemotaxis protein [Thermodesulfovibrionales bacterium]|nr:methyl-accepting chemotaxis protein [Thermodesulfovibrionales bacterium]